MWVKLLMWLIMMVCLHLAAWTADGGMRWCGVGREGGICWSCVCIWVQWGEWLSALQAHGWPVAGWEGEGRRGRIEVEEEEGWRVERWEDGWKARKGGEPWEGGGSTAGAWVFYEVKSVVR